jgi:hypothetical protein
VLCRRRGADGISCIHDIQPFFSEEIVKRGATRAGLTWHYNRWPVVDLEYEMDCRGVMDERIA